jgi:hypothetical protein
MEMIDVGEKRPDGPVAVESKGKNEKSYPTFYLSTKQLPGLKGLEPGDRGIMQIEYEVKGYSMRSTKDKKDEGNYDLEIQKIGLSDEKVKSQKEAKKTDDLKKEASERLKAGRNY